MKQREFESARIEHCHNAKAQDNGVWPTALDSTLGRDVIDHAIGEITSWPGYAPTPLHDLTSLSRELGIEKIYYKDEAYRFGLESFKALGGAYAVLRLLEQRISQSTGSPVNPGSIRAGEHAEEARKITVATATDGNHGRSVAWGAQTFGCPCKIYIHAEVSEGRRLAMGSLRCPSRAH